MAELETQENGGGAGPDAAAMGNQSVSTVANQVPHANVQQVRSHSVSMQWFRFDVL